MAEKLTAEQLNDLPKEALVELALSIQDQLIQVNSRMDDLMEQIAVANNHRFGRRSEKLEQFEGQGYFDADGNLYFNEAEAVNDVHPDPEEPILEKVLKKHVSRPKGKKEADLKDFPVIQLPVVEVPQEELIREFGSLDNCRRMDDEVFRRLVYIPAGWKVEETHVAVYRSRSGKKKFLKGKTPPYLLRGSIVSPSLEAAIINAKYANALPLRRIEKDFEQNGVSISEQNMASWTIKCADRYLSRVYNYLQKQLPSCHVLQADETTVEVTRDGRNAGSQSRMWVYRTGRFSTDHPIILYDYQLTRNHEHPLNFLDGFHGYLVCDGFSGYRTLGRKNEDIRISQCWAHARRKFSDAAKAAAQRPARTRTAEAALEMIAAIYHQENKLKDLSCEERQKERERHVRPLVDVFFAWVHKTAADNSLYMTGDTKKGIQYCINQEEYLKAFLEDGEIPIDNNFCESTIRGFTVGRKNWMMIDTISGAKASAIIYSLVETAKANSLHIYHYFEYLLEELCKLPEFLNEPEKETAAMERLMPWYEELPDICRKRGR